MGHSVAEVSLIPAPTLPSEHLVGSELPIGQKEPSGHSSGVVVPGPSSAAGPSQKYPEGHI
jgi:hypothetical protein